MPNQNAFDQYTSISRPPYIHVSMHGIGVATTMPFLQFNTSEFPNVSLDQLSRCSDEIQRRSGNTMLLMLADFGVGLVHLYQRDLKPKIPGTSDFSAENAMQMVLKTFGQPVGFAC